MIEIAIVAGLILLNGVFAMSELAIVSSRKALLRSMAESGRRGASSALALAENPGKFLSTVQIGITLVGIVAGAFSGATLGGSLGEILADAGVPASIAAPLGYGSVVAIITYLSVVVGELVPKQFALRHSETIACIIAPPMTILSQIAKPVVWLLDASTRAIFRLLGLSASAEDMVTEEEIKSMVNEAAETGVIERDERRMIAGVLRLSDDSARSLMTPRTDIEWIDLQDPPKAIEDVLRTTRRSRIPVADGHPDNIIGIIEVREYIAAGSPTTQQGLRKLIRKVPVIPDTLGALRVLARLRESELPIVLVHDEYGHFEGVVTPADLLEAIAGVFRSDVDVGDSEDAVEREDGSWLLSGSLPASSLTDILGITIPTRRDYQTTAGFFIEELQHLPRTGEAIETHGWRIEVVDMDGRRVDKLLATRLPASE